MLCLGEQIHGDPLGVNRPVREDQNFRGAGDHIDAHAPENLSLCFRNKAVTGTDNFVHPGNGGRAIGQCRNSLRAAHGVHLVNTRQRRGCQHRGVDFTTGRRCDHDNALYTGDFRWNRVHQHRRRIARPTAGHINTHAIERRDPLAQQIAFLVLVLPTLGTLTLVEPPNARRRPRERR